MRFNFLSHRPTRSASAARMVANSETFCSIRASFWVAKWRVFAHASASFWRSNPATSCRLAHAEPGVQIRRAKYAREATRRKEFGSLVCEQFGIYAASRALRHADIAITSQHYVDKKRRATVGLEICCYRGRGSDGQLRANSYAFTSAIRERLVTENPAKEFIDPIKRRNENQRRRAFAVPELQRLLTAAEEADKSTPLSLQSRRGLSIPGLTGASACCLRLIASSEAQSCFPQYRRQGR